MLILCAELTGSRPYASAPFPLPVTPTLVPQEEADAPPRASVSANAHAAAAGDAELKDDSDGNDGVRLDDLHQEEGQEEEEEEEEKEELGLPRAAWCEDPPALDTAFPPVPPSAQLTASQEGLQSLLRSKDRLEAQIQVRGR